MTHRDQKFLVKAVLLTGVFDAPARCAVQNMVQFNGFFGCGTCYIRGQSVENLKGTRTFVYKFDTSEENMQRGHPPLRTHQEVIQHAKLAEESSKPHIGVKGLAFIASAPKFDLIRGVTIDYMHTVLLGVMKMLLDLWLNKEYKNTSWYVGEQIKELDERLLSLSPPNRITRLPRKLSDLAHWKASELRSFLLYYGMPVLTGILEEEQLQHFFLLAKAVYFLLQTRITASDIQEAENAIIQFCMMMDAVYHESVEKSNIHALLHLPQKVKDLGPLWAHSCFFYEDLNGDLRQLLHGTVNASKQILRAVCRQQAFPKVAQMLRPGSSAEALYQDMTSYRKLQTEMHYIEEDVYAVSPIIPCTPTSKLKAVLTKHVGTDLYTLHKFHRLFLNHQVFHSKAYKAATRRNSYTVCFKTEKNEDMYGSIEYYLKLDLKNETKYAAVMHPLDVMHTVLPHVHQAQLRDDVILVSVTCIRELSLFLQGRDVNYVATFPNFIERE